jgi:hypothetical protein
LVPINQRHSYRGTPQSVGDAITAREGMLDHQVDLLPLREKLAKFRSFTVEGIPPVI